MIALAVAALLLVSSVAEACPSCLGQQRSLDSTLALVGVLLALPFVIGFFVVRAIRRLSAAERGD